MKPIVGSPQLHLPEWLTEEEFGRIEDIGTVWGKCILLQLDWCGTPVCPTPYVNGGLPLEVLRGTLPHLSFHFEAMWVDWTNWQHVLVIQKSRVLVHHDTFLNPPSTSHDTLLIPPPTGEDEESQSEPASTAVHSFDSAQTAACGTEAQTAPPQTAPSCDSARTSRLAQVSPMPADTSVDPGNEAH